VLGGISVFFPAYNEAKNIERVVASALEVIPKLAREYEIIIVDDGSSDVTGELADALTRANVNVRVVHHERNLGYGAALKSGFKNSKYEFIFYTDGDGQFDINQMRGLIELIDSADIAAGYRKKRMDPLYRRINAFAYNILIRFLFGLWHRDIDCGFKLLRKKIFEKITLESDGAFISAELLIKAKKENFRIKQIGVEHFSRRFGKPTGNHPKVVLQSFIELIKLYRKLAKPQ